MGLCICDLCEQQLGFSDELHVCKKDDILAHIRSLKQRAWTAQKNLDQLQNAVYLLLEPLGLPYSAKEASVSVQWLNKLWEAANCRWYEAKNVDNFLVRCMRYQQVLIQSSRLFRKPYSVKPDEQLEKLFVAVDEAQKFLYGDGKFDTTVEEVLKRFRNG